MTFSCTSDNYEDLHAKYQEPANDSCSVNISYTHNILPIINANGCGGGYCHGGGGAGGLSLPDYDNLKFVALNGKLEDAITGRSSNPMPPGGSLTACEIEQIITWINDGAPNN